MSLAAQAQFKSAWIIGASSGIGRELAVALAQGNSRVFATARRAELLEELAAVNENIVALPADVLDETQLAAARDTAVSACDHLDLVVINAAVYRPMPTCRVTGSVAAEHIATNLQGAVNCAAAVLPGLINSSRRCRLVFVASISGWRGLPNASFYAATKAALISYAESLRCELHGSNVVVQVISPGFVDTPMTELNKFKMPGIISAKTAAAAIVRGLSSERFEIHFPGKITWPTKLVSLLPAALYFPLMRKITRVDAKSLPDPANPEKQ